MSTKQKVENRIRELLGITDIEKTLHIEELFSAIGLGKNICKFEFNEIQLDSRGYIKWIYRDFGDEIDFEETAFYDFSKVLSKQDDDVFALIKKAIF